MALDPKGAALALHRFGFGPRPGLISAVASDPRGALLAELDRPNAGQIVDSTLQSAAAENRAVFEFNAERAARDKLARLRHEALPRAMLNDGVCTFQVTGCLNVTDNRLPMCHPPGTQSINLRAPSKVNPKDTKISSADDLIKISKTGKGGDVELEEQELKRVTGGAINVKFK